MAALAPATDFEVGVGIVVLTLGVSGVAIALLSEVLSNRKQMSDSGRDWGASSDESIRAFNAAKRNAKIENAIKQLDSLHALTAQGEWSETHPRTNSVESVYCNGEMVACCCYCKRETSEPTAKFVACVHNAWPIISDELKRLRACKIDGMTVDDLNRLRQMLVDSTAARSDFEKALNASEDRVAELLRENADLEGWKCSAIEAIARWDKCHIAAGSPANPGQCMSEATEREILRLRQQVAELNAKLDTEKRAAISIAVAALDTGCVKPESKGTVEAVNDMSAEISRLRELAAEMADSMQTMHDMLNILDYPITTAVQSKAKELIRKAEGVVK